jgi:hypothetical protein
LCRCPTQEASVLEWAVLKDGHWMEVEIHLQGTDRSCGFKQTKNWAGGKGMDKQFQWQVWSDCSLLVFVLGVIVV